MNRRELLGAVMAAFSWLVALLGLAYYWRFNVPHDWVTRMSEHGSIEQVCLLAWLVLILICNYEGEKDHD